MLRAVQYASAHTTRRGKRVAYAGSEGATLSSILAIYRSARLPAGRRVTTAAE
jgi:hypothetical protein